MLPSYFDYIFVPLKQKVRLRPEPCPNPARIQTQPEKLSPTYNSASNIMLRSVLEQFNQQSAAKKIQDKKKYVLKPHPGLVKLYQ